MRPLLLAAALLVSCGPEPRPEPASRKTVKAPPPREDGEPSAPRRHARHEHGHLHPHGSGDHHHHPHPHPHMRGEHGHHHPY